MKIRGAIDNSRRVLSGTIIGFVGKSAETNPFEEYSNPDLRYLTLINVHIWVLRKKNDEFESKTWNYRISMIGTKDVVESCTYASTRQKK